MKLSFLPKRKILSLDIGAYEIKVVEGRFSRNGIIINNYFTIDMPENAYNDGIIVDRDLVYYVLEEGIRANQTKSRNTYATINSSSIITREVIIPRVDYEEIENILEFQLDDYIPMNPENYIVQFKIIDVIYQDDIEKLKILLIAIPKEIIEGYHKLLIDLNLNPLILDYQPNSIAKLTEFNGFINDIYPTAGVTIAAIDIGYDSTKVSIIRDGIVQVSRVVEIAGRYIDQNILSFSNLAKDELELVKQEIKDINHIDRNYSKDDYVVNSIRNALGELNEKINFIFKYYLTREMNNKIDIIILFGGYADIGGIDNFYSNYFNIPSIKIKNLNNVHFDGKLSTYINPIGSIIRTIGV